MTREDLAVTARRHERQPRKDSSIVVILPTIAVDHWLDLAVDSLLSEPAPEFRLVVVHDGVAPDPDRNWMSDPRVSAMHIPVRGGLVGALITAIASTDSEYIARLDADDLSLPGRLRKQLSYLQAHSDTALVGSGAAIIDGDGTQTGLFRTRAGGDVRPELLKRNFIVHSSVLLRRADYERAGGYDERLPQMEDYELWLRIAARSKVAVLPDALVAHRRHKEQVSTGARPFGIHIRAVKYARRRLARQLDYPQARYLVHNLAWSGAQYLRYGRAVWARRALVR